MARFDTDPKKLTFGEAIRRLQANPDDPDPEIQEFKKSIEKITKTYIIPASIIIKQYSESVNRALESNRAQFQMMQKTLDSTKSALAILASYKPPTYLFDAMRKMAEDFNRLPEMLRAVGETIAIYKTPLLYYKLPELQNNVVIEKYEPEKAETEPEKSLEVELLRENNYLLKEIVRLKKTELNVDNKHYHYDIGSKTFVIKTISWGAIPFISKRGNRTMAYFFEICIELLEKKGKVVGNFKEVYISMNEFIQGFKARGIVDITNRAISFIRKNIMNEKIKPQGLENYVSISSFDKARGVYCFRIMIKYPSFES